MIYPPSCSGCPIRATSRGFALDAGDPVRARIGFLFETPASTEIGWRCEPGEVALRKRDYPADVIPSSSTFLVGEPVVGPTGAIFESWLLRAVGLKREDCYLGNVLHCFPEKSKGGSHYPTGSNRKEAERRCAVFNKRWELFWRDAPLQAELISIHPASLLREVTPLPLVTQFQRVPGLYSDLQKAADMVSQGYKVRVLMGAKAVESILGYGGNVSKWRGHFFVRKPNGVSG